MISQSRNMKLLINMKVKQLIQVLFLVAGVSLYACSSKEKAAEEVKDESVLVTTSKVTLEEVNQEFSYTATVQPYKRNAINPAQPNRIRQIYVEVGQNVKKGQLLAELDETNANQQKMQLANLEKDLSRVKELVAVGGASKQQLDQLVVQVDVAKEALKLMLENSRLVSPVDGVVTARNFDEGDMCSGQPLFIVMQIRPVKLLIHINEEIYRTIKLGLPIDVKTDVWGDEVFKGKISLIYPTIDEVSRTFGVEITIPNNDMRIRPGMFARANVNWGSKNKLVVSDLAVLRQPGSDERYVFVVEDGIARYRSIQIGTRFGDKFVVESGLSENEEVVVSGMSRLVDGKPIVRK